MPSAKLPDGIIEATHPDPTNVPEVLERLKAIQETLDKATREALDDEEIAADADPADFNTALAYLAKRQDGLACFNYLYRVITAEINNKINQGNFFHNNEFLTKFDVAFAKRYLGAIREYAADGSGPVPACWRVLFENRENSEINPMQFAVCGVVCHVWFDLPIALVSVVKEMKKSPDTHIKSLDTRVHDDFQEVNLIFYKKIPKLRRHFEDTSERALDHSIIKRLANHLCDFTVLWARDIAWRHGMELWEVWDSPGLGAKENDLDKRASYISRGTLGLL